MGPQDRAGASAEGSLNKTPPKGAGFELAPSVCSLVDVMKVGQLSQEHEKPLATEGQAQKSKGANKGSLRWAPTYKWT
ncbi:hypothetical protein AVEN_94606-1 [Araneus ventricosus]|uniref:Uncharacterized protein n=1 Tax=Araneus ventricosus TaxID=182803 RepID=A0A4Y2TH52_ARAVE|nr:hypothetical protein AVEN_94606-1 [Araneus ventricosus]